MYRNVSNKIPTLAAFILSILAWLILVYSPLWAAIEIWIGNEIYNHCLIVIPASIYLIFERRNQIDWSSMNMSWFALFIFFGQLLFYILGSAADIQLFQHIALFSMLPTIVWIFIGNKLAWQFKFPLCFVIFSVPVGEELIPILQEITADMSVFLLDATGIPLFRSGLFIEIPQGKFLVAEACSGVSFLIASIVLGNLYAYMNLVSWKTRVFFVGLSIVFPIIANSIRVYGIIYIGYSTNMEHAVGADHLIYGWFFFAFVLICLFLLGETIRRIEVKRLKLKEKNSQNSTTNSTSENIHQADKSTVKNFHTAHGFKLGIFIALILMLVITKIQTLRMTSTISELAEPLVLNLDAFPEAEHNHIVMWLPKYVGNSEEKMYHLRNQELDFDVFYAYFDGTDGELVSSLNRLYVQDRWTLLNNKGRSINGVDVNETNITTSVGIQKRVVYWYLVGDQLVNSFKDVKIQQLLLRLKGEQFQTAIIAVAVDLDPNMHIDEDNFIKFISIIIENNRTLSVK